MSTETSDPFPTVEIISRNEWAEPFGHLFIDLQAHITAYVLAATGSLGAMPLVADFSVSYEEEINGVATDGIVVNPWVGGAGRFQAHHPCITYPLGPATVVVDDWFDGNAHQRTQAIDSWEFLKHLALQRETSNALEVVYAEDVMFLIGNLGIPHNRARIMTITSELAGCYRRTFHETRSLAMGLMLERPDGYVYCMGPTARLDNPLVARELADAASRDGYLEGYRLHLMMY